jgi:hypothetical protein
MGSRGLGQLAYDKGMRIIAATQANDVALEVGKLKQGLLSYALIKDGIEEGKANIEEPGKPELFTGEWLRYSEQRVPELYDEIRTGKLRNVTVQGKSPDEKTRSEIFCIGENCTRQTHRQRPGIFDFRRNKKDALLINLPK